MVKLEWYRIFHAVACYKSFSAAAKQLYLSQPAVSQAIKQLEEELGCKLFSRTGKGVSLTVEGNILAERVAAALELIASGEEKLRRMKKLEWGRLKIGVGDTAARSFLLHYLERYHTNHPQIHLSTINRTSYELISLVKKGHLDLAVINLPVEDDALEIVECFDIQDVFVAAEKYAWLRGRELSLEEVAGLPLIMLENKANSRNFVDRYFHSKGIDLHPDIELGSHELLLEFATINLGVSCVIQEFSRDYLDSGKLFPLRLREPLPKRSVAYCYLKNISLSLAAREFVEMLPRKEATFSTVK